MIEDRNVKKGSMKNLNETYFQWWLDDLIQLGIVKSYEREPETFSVLDPVTVSVKKNFKRKDSEWRVKNITRPLFWTPDYKVIFDRCVINKFISVIETNEHGHFFKDYSETFPGSGKFDNVYQETKFITCVRDNENIFNSDDRNLTVWFDVKPPANAVRFSKGLGSSRDFRFLRTLLFEREQIYVNKVVPIELYFETFLPKRYLFTDGGTKSRLIKKKFKLIEQWMSEKDIHYDG